VQLAGYKPVVYADVPVFDQLTQYVYQDVPVDNGNNITVGVKIGTLDLTNTGADMNGPIV
jgi:hypothetical protein